MSPALIGARPAALIAASAWAGEATAPNRRGPEALRALVKSEIARLTPIIAAASAKWVH